MIQQDRISIILLVLATLIITFLATFDNTAVVVFPVILLTVGLVMHEVVSKKHKTEYDDSAIDENLVRTTIWYTVPAIFGMLLCSYAIQHFSLTTESLQLTGYSAFLYNVLIGIAEEQFFRGFITDWLLVTLPNEYGALFISAAYVFAGGFILSWTAYKSRRISPPMLGHVINNAWAYFQNLNPQASQFIVTMVKVILK
jgi:membrane protease YdiL (CAAX protease family)